MKIDLNTASCEELTQLRMITPNRARDIVQYREQHGPFTSWDQLKNVPGISREMSLEIQREGGTLGSAEEAA